MVPMSKETFDRLMKDLFDPKKDTIDMGRVTEKLWRIVEYGKLTRPILDDFMTHFYLYCAHVFAAQLTKKLKAKKPRKRKKPEPLFSARIG